MTSAELQPAIAAQVPINVARQRLWNAKFALDVPTDVTEARAAIAAAKVAIAEAEAILDA